MSNQDVPQIENIDNYLAAIEMAKEELRILNAQIKLATDKKNDLISGNDILLKEKTAEIESKKEEAELLHATANQTHAKNDMLANELANKEAKFNVDREILTLSQNEHSTIVSNKEQEFEVREQAIKDMLLEIEKTKKCLEMQKNDNDANIQCVLNEKKEAQDLLDKVKSEKQAIEEEKLLIAQDIESYKSIKREVENVKISTDARLIEIQKALDETRKNRIESESNLAATLKEKQTLNDLIIESKKTKLEAIKAVEAAQRNIVEANLKIADLKDLKEAMAKA